MGVRDAEKGLGLWESNKGTVVCGSYKGSNGWLGFIQVEGQSMCLFLANTSVTHGGGNMAIQYTQLNAIIFMNLCFNLV